MKKNRVIPALMAGLLATVLTGCSSGGGSGGSSQSPEPEAKAKQMSPEEAEKQRLEEERLAKEKAAKAREERAQSEDFKWREFFAIPSGEGGDAFRPVKKGDDKVFYSSGPRVLVKDGKTVLLDDNELQYDRDFLKHQEADPSKVQELVVTDKEGTTLGKFQFVNQQYSSYGHFMSDKAADEAGRTEYHSPLNFYTAKPSTETQLNAQKGSANYTGKAIGYRRDSAGKVSTEAATADVNFKVDFDKKTISGSINNRFDDLDRNLWLEDYDDDGNPKYSADYASHYSNPLILKETYINVNDQGNVSFGSKDGSGKKNVAVNYNGKETDVSHYSGVFSGSNLEDIVGQIGSGGERIIFGAEKQAQ